VAEDIQLWSEELARDPSSRAFVPLADTLRRRGQLDMARKVITRGLERHPRDGDAHDVMARIWADRGETARAMEEWAIALQCSPRHAGALKGLAFAHFQAGQLAEAERLLVEAVAADPEDASARVAIGRVRLARGENGTVEDLPSIEAGGSPPESPVSDSMPDAGSMEEVLALVPGGPVTAPELPVRSGSVEHTVTNRVGLSPILNPAAQARELFVDLLGGGEQAALLLDAEGLVIAGTYFVAGGHDAAEDVGAALSGVGDEARRAMRHLELGTWTSLVFETEAATVAMGPVNAPALGEDGLALVAAARSVPLGFVRQLLRRVGQRSAAWLGVQAGGGLPS
jgi:tetratricopeptide (TPR) repeat protein